jgi:hypothetical protein
MENEELILNHDANLGTNTMPGFGTKDAFELAQRRPKKHLTSATKSNGIAITMPYWDERVEAMSRQYPEVTVDRFHIDILTAHFVQRPQQFGQGIHQQGLDRCGVRDLGLLDSALQVSQQVLGGRQAGVGHQQGGFEFLVQGIVDAGAGEHLRDALTSLAQAGLEAAEPAHALRTQLGCRGRGWWGCRL